jgi:hypothetical protein
MSKITYKGKLSIFIRHPDKNKPAGFSVEILAVPFQSFEVDGGGAKKINLNSTDEPQIVSGIEQAINQKSFTVYLKQGIEVPSAKLIDLAKSSQKYFTTHFMIMFFKDDSLSRTIGLLTTANLSETPIPVGGTPALLKMMFAFKSIDAYRGMLDRKTALIPGLAEHEFA